MKTTKLIANCLAVFALTGCSTVNSRIKEMSQVYYALEPETRAKIDQGIIDPGLTPDMVYIALGAPDEKRQRRDFDGQTEVWIYNAYYDRFEGTRRGGYYRNVVFDPVTRVYRVYWTPAYDAVYSQQKEEKIRITFRNGAVTTIEQSREDSS